jgi:hypothetical protein
MQYSTIRPTIRSGDLIAFSHGGWSSWSSFKTMLVRMFTLSTYSHVAVAWVVAGRVFILEAVKPKTRIFPLSLEGDFYHLPLGAPWKPETEEFALQRIGVDYSEVNAVRAYFKPLEAGNVSECSAYVREVMLVDGIRLGELARPDAVIKAAQARGAKLTFVENGGPK